MARLSPWKVLESEVVADCRVFSVHGRRSERADGRAGTFYGIETSDWVNVVARTDGGELVLVRQYRHGVGREILELPGGMIDEGESPEEAARRELVEETGYVPERVVLIGSANPNPALFSNVQHTVLAEGCRPTGEVDLDEHEQTLVELVPEAAIAELVRAGRIDHCLVLAALQWLSLRGP